MKAHIGGYCDCFTSEVKRQYTPGKFSKVVALDSAGMAKERKLNRLVETCGDKMDHL